MTSIAQITCPYKFLELVNGSTNTATIIYGKSMHLTKFKSMLDLDVVVSVNVILGIDQGSFKTLKLQGFQIKK